MEENQDIHTPEKDKVTDTGDLAQEVETSAAETPAEEVSVEETLRQEIEHLKDQHLRTAAEFDNYRKRTLKEKSELIKNGGEKVLVELLPIVDDFELAIKHSDETDEEDPMREGILLIYNKMMEFLRKQGIQPIETENAPFDDQYHEAIALVPAPEESLKGKVIDCIQKGYTLGEKVIRYARVVVGE